MFWTFNRNSLEKEVFSTFTGTFLFPFKTHFENGNVAHLILPFYKTLPFGEVHLTQREVARTSIKVLIQIFLKTWPTISATISSWVFSRWRLGAAAALAKRERISVGGDMVILTWWY